MTIRKVVIPTDETIPSVVELSRSGGIPYLCKIVGVKGFLDRFAGPRNDADFST